MKRRTLAIVFAWCALALVAQNSIKVNYKGSKPTISDFGWSYLSQAIISDGDCIDESTNAIKQAWINHRKGLPLDKGDKLTIDEKNGYAVYESVYENSMLRIEMCYWNEADGKHKLFAYNIKGFQDGKYSPGQFDGLYFWRYSNSKKKMTRCDAPGFELVFCTEDGDQISYDLPRVGKNIVVNVWKDSGKESRTLKWNGRRFSPPSR